SRLAVIRRRETRLTRGNAGVPAGLKIEPRHTEVGLNTARFETCGDRPRGATLSTRINVGVTQHNAFPVYCGIRIEGGQWKWRQEASRAIEHIKTIVRDYHFSCWRVPVKVEDEAVAMNRVETTTACRIVLADRSVHR